MFIFLQKTRIFNVRKVFAVILLLLFCSNVKAQYLWQVYADTVVEWRYQDGDEFSWGIDKNKWHLGFPWGDKIFTQRTYVSTENIKEKDGQISFTIQKSDTLIRLHPTEIDSAAFKKNRLNLVDSNKFRFLYSGGLLWSKRKYSYGYYELKFKGVEGSEIWPAFWLYGGEPNYEIDFFELKGEQPNDLHVDIHCPDGCRNYRKNVIGRRVSYGHWVKLNAKLKDNYNVLAGEWTSTYVKWYLNGELIAYASTNITMPMGLSIGNGINVTGSDYPKKNSAAFPNTFEVDYLRIYRSDTLADTRYLSKHLPTMSNDPQLSAGDLQTKKTSAKLTNSQPFKKSEQLLTVSIQQVSKQELQLRVLGQAATDTVRFVFNNSSEQSCLLKGNTEQRIALPSKNAASVEIFVGNKTIKKQLRFD